MTRLITIWLDICLLRAGPQDLPASNVLLALALSAYALVALGVSLMSASLPAALGITAIDVLLMAAFASLLLRWTNKVARLNQTLTALGGTGALLGLLAWPLISMILRSQGQEEAPDLPVLLWLGLLIWNLAVVAHIVRHALSTTFLTGMGLSIVYALITYTVINSLYPPVTT
jgi:hypothetical protein